MAKGFLSQNNPGQEGGTLVIDGTAVCMTDTVETFCGTYESYHFEAYIRSRLPVFLRWNAVKNLTVEKVCSMLGGTRAVQAQLDAYIEGRKG